MTCANARVLYILLVTVLACSLAHNQAENSQTNSRSIETVVNKAEGVASALRYSNTSKTIAHGVIAATNDGVFIIDLNSLQQTNISTDPAIAVAFDWNSSKVYWVVDDGGIKRSNLDGTDVELVVKGIVTSTLAVDWITGNIYYQSYRSKQLTVCSSSGKCSDVAAEHQGRISDIALHPSKGIMFWIVMGSNSHSVIRANMGGTNATVLTSETDTFVIGLDEDSDRLYWEEHAGSPKVCSFDLNGQDRRVLVEASPSKIAVHGTTVYLGSAFGDKTIQYVNKDGGNNVTLVARFAHRVGSIALYGSKPGYEHNPCQSAACSHLCVLKLKSFACLCLEGQKLAPDGKDCV